MSKGLGKVQIQVLRYIGRYPLTGATYRNTRIMLGLNAQTLSRAIRRLCEEEYIKKARPDWYGDGDPTEVYLLTSRGLAAYAAHAADKC